MTQMRAAFLVCSWIIAASFAPAIAGCGGSTTPGAPTPPATPAVAPVAPVAPDSLVVFSEPATGFSTSDLHDAQDRIVQFTSGGDLIWTPDGTRLHGFDAAPDRYYGPPTYFIAGAICPSQCWLSVRFGSRDGQRTAYLTADYGHSNPGTLVDVQVEAKSLIVTQTSAFPPGTPTLTGTITERAAAGDRPVEGALVSRSVPAGWQFAKTDSHGFYTIQGLIDGSAEVVVAKEGYARDSRMVTLSGDLTLDVRLVRQ